MAKKKEVKEEKKTKVDEKSFAFVYGEPLSIDKDEQKRLVEKYCLLIEEDLKARSDRETEWQLNADISASTRPAKSRPWPGASHVALGSCNEMCDVVSDSIITRMNSGNRIYNLTGLDDYSMAHEEEVENWVNYIIDTEEEYKFTDEEVRTMINDDCVTSVMNMERNERTVKKWQNLGVLTKVINTVVNVIGNYKLIEKKEVQIRHVSKVIKIEDVIAPSNATNNIQNLPYFGYFFFPVLDELKDTNSKNPDKPYYVNLDKFEKKTEIEATKDETKEAEKDSKVQVENVVASFKVAVLCIKEDINKDGALEDLILIFNYPTKTFLRMQYNQFFDGKRPFNYACANPDRDKFHGQSFKSKGRPLQLELEAMVDQTLDNWDLVIKKIFARISGASITVGSQDGDDNTLFPGSIVEVSEKGALEVLNVGSIDYNSLPLINKIEAMLTRVFGLSVAGGSDMGDPRASGKKVGLLMAQGSQKIDGIFKRYNNSKANYIKMLISRYAQYGIKLTYRVWDKEKKKYVIKEIGRDVLQECNFKITLNALQFSSSREQEKQEELWLYETLLKSPLFSLKPMDLAQYSDAQLNSIIALTKDLIDKYGKYNKERLLPDVDELKQSIGMIIQKKIEDAMKEQMKAALANPNKAQPFEIEKVQRMAQETDISGMIPNGGQNVGPE